jgi:outer membrane protein assembly factor BamB
MRRPLLALFAMVAVAATALLVVLGPDDERFAAGSNAPSLPPPLVHPELAAAPPRQGVPPEVRDAAREWPLPNADYANTRSTTQSRISSATIGDLGIAWAKPLHTASHWGAAASAPLIAGGVVYFQDLQSDVAALDLNTGRERWRHDLPQASFGPNGPAIGWGKVFAQDGGNRLHALDLHDGSERWATPLDGPTGAHQPMAYDGFVYTAIASGRKLMVGRDRLQMRLLGAGSSGFVYGIRADDGRIAWDFMTVEPGFWGNRHVNAGGGVWFGPAVDTRTGDTFWSAGNPGPAPGIKGQPNGSSRPGPNLYSNSALAFDRAGRNRWHFQAKPHDLFHHDLQNPDILVRAGGRDLVIASGKGGTVFALDRGTGRLVWKRPIGRHLNDLRQKLPLDGRAVTVYPGFWGGIETPGAAAGGTLYFLTENLPTPYTATAWGSQESSETVQSLEGRTPLDRGTSELVALDAATGRARWTHAFDQIGFGGATVVNDLVLTATYDGTIHALDRRDGRELRRIHAPAGINAWPAVSGDTIVWPAGLGRTPVLLALRLGAHGPEPPPPRTRVDGAVRDR